MRKYVKSLLTLAVIILGIGAFYTQSVLSAGGYPSFQIMHQSGDEEEIEPVIVNATYSLGQRNKSNSIDESLQITANGSMYDNDASYIEQVNGEVGEQQFIKQLRKEHRNFMRGKLPDPNAFFENDRYLAYGEVSMEMERLGTGTPEFTFHISVLDKEEQETESFAMDLQESSSIDNIQLEEVQMLDDVLKVVTVNEPAEEKEDTEVHVYDFDVAANKLVKDKKIWTSPEPGDEQYVEANIISKTGHDLKKNHIVLQQKILREDEWEDGFQTKEMDNKVIVYNLETNEEEEVDIPENMEPAFYDDSFIYFIEDENDFGAATYQINDKEFIQQTTVENTKQTDVAEDQNYTIKSGKLYLVTQQATPGIYIVDLQSGEQLYKGKIMQENPMIDDKNDALHLGNIEVE